MRGFDARRTSRSSPWRAAGCAIAVAAGFACSIPECAVAQEVAGVVALPDSIPVRGARVELHRVTEQGGVVVDSTVSDAMGRFSFLLSSNEEPGAVFLAAARHHGILYWGPPVHAASPTDRVDYVVAVFDTTVVSAPDGDLRTSIRHVVITPGIAGLQVEEIIDIEGRPERTLVTSVDSIPVWVAELGAGASGVVLAEGGAPAE